MSLLSKKSSHKARHGGDVFGTLDSLPPEEAEQDLARSSPRKPNGLVVVWASCPTRIHVKQEPSYRRGVIVILCIFINEHLHTLLNEMQLCVCFKMCGSFTTRLLGI